MIFSELILSFARIDLIFVNFVNLDSNANIIWNDTWLRAKYTGFIQNSKDKILNVLIRLIYCKYWDMMNFKEYYIAYNVKLCYTKNILYDGYPIMAILFHLLFITISLIWHIAPQSLFTCAIRWKYSKSVSSNCNFTGKKFFLPYNSS